MSLYILVVCVCVYVRMCVYESSVITLPPPPPSRKHAVQRGCDHINLVSIELR